ncbi:MAG: universal stress protein, partial [Candidatus Hodarchaeota archaeon]
KVERISIFVQKEDMGFPWDFRKILALTDSSKEGRKALFVAAGLASVHEGALIIGLIRPDHEIKSFLKVMLEVDLLAEFGDSEPHEKSEDDKVLPWTEGIADDESLNVKVEVFPGQDIEEVTSFIERERVDLVVLPANYGLKEEDSENKSATSDKLSLFARIIAYETPSSVFLVRRRKTLPKVEEEAKEDREEDESPDETNYTEEEG